MGCNCKHNQEDIQNGYKLISELREMFIKRMTVDSETQDRRRRDFNQAIFGYESDEDVEMWNKDCAKWGLAPKRKGDTYPCWFPMTMDLVLRCFDDAVKDWRRTWCDVENCRRKP